MLVRMNVLHKCVPWQGYLAIQQKNQQYVGSGQCTYVHLYCIMIIQKLCRILAFIFVTAAMPSYGNESVCAYHAAAEYYILEIEFGDFNLVLRVIKEEGTELLLYFRSV